MLGTHLLINPGFTGADGGQQSDFFKSRFFDQKADRFLDHIDHRDGDSASNIFDPKMRGIAGNDNKRRSALLQDLARLSQNPSDLLELIVQNRVGSIRNLRVRVNERGDVVLVLSGRCEIEDFLIKKDRRLGSHAPQNANGLHRLCRQMLLLAVKIDPNLGVLMPSLGAVI